MEKADTLKSECDTYVEAETVFEDSEISSLSNITDAVSEKKADNSSCEILFIEPFYGGSHKQLIDTIDSYLSENLTPTRSKIHLYTLPAKKWHWRARTSALYFSEKIPENVDYKVLFCSSVLNLAELIALRPDLHKLYKIIYFHENQLVYPIQECKDRDFQYGYNQILSSMVADVVVFNSQYNMNSFLSNINRFLKIQPDFHVKNLDNKILPKCRVIYFPVEIPNFSKTRGNILHIIWPHRWEHDKNPDLFFEVLFKLKNNNLPFVVSILGESFNEIPEIFLKGKEILKDEILQFGRVSSRESYYKILRSGHVVVSTAIHEFFGVAVMESVMSNCFPLLPNNLVYPEFYPSMCLYKTPNQLYKKLKMFCEKPYLTDVYLKKAQINLDKFNFNFIMKDFKNIFFKDIS